MRPFFRYYGGKFRAAPTYPEPKHGLIIEPFAGSAGYSMRYPGKSVLLVDRDPVIAGIWRYLIGARPDDVMDIPLVDAVADLPEWVPLGARELIGFTMNAATTGPRPRLSAGCRKLRDSGRKFYGWTEEYRERVASQVNLIKHWRIFEGDYSIAGDEVGTWFIDPTYKGAAGEHYRHHLRDAEFGRLAGFCETRRGQVIVCEAQGADWLKFRPHGVFKAGPKSKQTAEAIWTRG